jgi:hypothetical protein
MRKQSTEHGKKRPEKAEKKAINQEQRRCTFEEFYALQGIGRDFPVDEDLAEERRKERLREAAKIAASESFETLKL